MTIYHTDAPAWLCHFTPMSRAHWCWTFMRPIISLSGPQRTIDGQTVDIGDGSTMSEHVKGTPSFATREEADQWATDNGFAYSYAEID